MIINNDIAILGKIGRYNLIGIILATILSWYFFYLCVLFFTGIDMTLWQTIKYEFMITFILQIHTIFQKKIK